VPHVAVFDTAFHATIPVEAATYAIDAELAARHGVRRYGFHGTSYEYVSRVAAETLDRGPGELRMIVLHLGNGASAAAISGGRSVDTSMGLTPLEGLVMGTRSGDLDPAIPFHLHRVAGLSIDELDDLLNRRSGLLGLSGHADMREVIEAAETGDERAGLALEVYLHRIRHYIGAFAAVLGGLDALVFTAGVGENSDVVRAGAVRGLEFLGIAIDPAANATRGDAARIISPAGSAVAVLVVPTDEELEIARQTVARVAEVRG
jgi:acetate kinase